MRASVDGKPNIRRPMSILLDVPEDVTRSLLCEWLVYVEYGLLDVAISNYSQRTYFDSILQCIPEVRIPVLPRVNVTLYNWIWTKNLKLINLHLTPFCFDDGEGIRFQVNTNHLKEISIACKGIPSGMPSFLSKCEHLSSLQTNKAKVVLGLNQHLLSNLTSLHISERLLYDDGREIAAALSETCFNLQVLVLMFGSGRYYVEEYATLLKSNINLHTVRLDGNDTILEAILAYCPIIEFLHLDGDYSYSLISRCILGLDHISTLQISNVKYERRPETSAIEVQQYGETVWSELFVGLVGLHHFTTQCSLSVFHIQHLIATCCCTLQSLSIVSHDSYSSSCIESILQNCVRLERLVIKHDGEGDPFCAFASTNCASLTDLRLSGSSLSILSVMKIIQHCPNLNDFTFRGVVEEMALISSYKRLLYELYPTRRTLKGTICFNTLIMNNFINRRVKLVFEYGRFGGVLVDKYLTSDELKVNGGSSATLVDENSVD